MPATPGTPYHVAQRPWGEVAKQVPPTIQQPEIDPPIHFYIDAQELGQLFATHTRPDRYKQILLKKLREAGGPVGGVINLYLQRGKLARINPASLPAQGIIHYMWISDERAKQVAEYQRQMAMANR
jgi:hypothetical protein